MTCNHCVRSIETALKDAMGIDSVRVSLKEELVEVGFQSGKIDPKSIISIIEQEGYQVQK